MKLIIFTTFVLLPLMGLANFPFHSNLNSKFEIEFRKEKINESELKYENQRFSNIKLKKYFKKRKNFVVGGGYNFYLNGQGKEALLLLENEELENNPSLNFGGILFDHFYIGVEIHKGSRAFLETRIYAPTINLYYSHKLLGYIDISGIGYDYFLNKNISIGAEASLYSYSRGWKRTSFVGNSDSWFGFDILTTSYRERHSGKKLSLKIQFHF